MRMIYRSASKRRLGSSPSLFRDVLERLSFYLLWIFSRLITVRSALCRFLLFGQAWVAVSVFILPWVGPLFIACWLWRRKAVPLLLRRFSASQDIPETSLTLRNSGYCHMVLKFAGQPSLQKIQEQVQSILELHGSTNDSWKLKRRLVRLRFGFWAWREDESFHVRNHVTLCEEVFQGVPVSTRNLKYKINELCGVPLDSNFSPWHVYVVPFAESGSRSPCYALLIRAHHLIGDFFRIEDFCSGDPEERHLRKAVVSALTHNRSAQGFAEDIVDDENNQEEGVTKIIEHIKSAVWFIWRAPAVLIHELLCCIQHLIKSKSPVFGTCRRAIAWSEAIPRDLLARLKEASGAESIDTVLLACLSGALHHYELVSGNREIRGDSLWSLIPRGNGFVRVALPIGECCPKARLRRVRSSLTRGLGEAKYLLSCILSMVWSKIMPTSVGSYLARGFCHRYPVLVDSVQVPTSDCSILEANYWKLVPVDFGLTITFVHFGDQVTLSAMSDFETLQRPDLLTSCFGRAVLDLALALDVRYERRPSPPPTPTKTSHRGSFSAA